MKKLIVIAVSIIHVLPHPFGVSAVGAAALYAGAYGDARWSWAVPFIPLGCGLLVTGLYEPLVMVFVFAAYSLSTFAGRWFLMLRRTLPHFAAAVLSGAAIFYLLSNFSIWLVYYPRTSAGLIECYLAGLPYLGLAALADTVYCFALFGLHAGIEHRQRQFATI